MPRRFIHAVAVSIEAVVVTFLCIIKNEEGIVITIIHANAVITIY